MIKVSIDVKNLPPDYDPDPGAFLVVRIVAAEFWYYGTYKEKHRADYAALEIGNGMVFKLARG